MPGTRSNLIVVLPVALLAFAACSTGEDGQPAVTPSLPDGAEAISFLGDTLFPAELSEEARAIYLERYAEAEDALVAAPEDADALIWMGRRTAYLYQYRSALDIYSHALMLHPDDPRIYRHRGHRYLSVREPDNAIADLERAAELINGQPDEVELDGASVHPDSVVATSYWLYMTLRRLGRDAEAAVVLDGITADMEIIESTSYLDLLLLFKGERTLEDLTGPAGEEASLQSTTTAYGIGVWHMLNDRPAEARETWERMRMARNQWAAFGYIAAESELAHGDAR